MVVGNQVKLWLNSAGPSYFTTSLTNAHLVLHRVTPRPTTHCNHYTTILRHEHLSHKYGILIFGRVYAPRLASVLGPRKPSTGKIAGFRLAVGPRTYSLNARRNRLFIKHTSTYHPIHPPSIPAPSFPPIYSNPKYSNLFRMSLLASSSRLLRKHTGQTARLVPRTYATFTELPRPPPSKQPEPIIFSAPSRPRQYYARPQHKRDLPPVPVRLTPILTPYPYSPSFSLTHSHTSPEFVAKMACIAGSGCSRSIDLGCILRLRDEPRETHEFGRETSPLGLA